jgi:transcriptional regulator with XRE-family HTH domain
MDPNIIGQNIKSFREKLALKQDDLADYLGVDRVNISYWENGNRQTPVNYLNKLADLFMVDLADLLEEEMEQKNASVALAFRADTLSGDDLRTIASFKKIVKNYLKMIELDKES